MFAARQLRAETGQTSGLVDASRLRPSEGGSAPCGLGVWSKIEPTTDRQLSQLTPAERLVAVHVARGLSNKEISSVLNRAEPTIKHQLSSALAKLGLQSRCQLIVHLLRR